MNVKYCDECKVSSQICSVHIFTFTNYYPCSTYLKKDVSKCVCDTKIEFLSLKSISVISVKYTLFALNTNNSVICGTNISSGSFLSTFVSTNKKP